MAKSLFLLASFLLIFLPTSYARLWDNALAGKEEHADSDLQLMLLPREEDENVTSVFISMLPELKRMGYEHKTDNTRYPLIFFHHGPVPITRYRTIYFTKRENDVQDSFDLVGVTYCLDVNDSFRQLYAVECENPEESSYILRYYEKRESICLNDGSDLCLSEGVREGAILVPDKKFKVKS